MPNYKSERFNNFMAIGESIIDTAYDENIKALDQIDTLTSMEAFALGVSLVLYGFESNKEGCESVFEKSLAILETQWDRPKVFN